MTAASPGRLDGGRAFSSAAALGLLLIWALLRRWLSSQASLRKEPNIRIHQFFKAETLDASPTRLLEAVDAVSIRKGFLIAVFPLDEGQNSGESCFAPNFFCSLFSQVIPCDG